MNNIGGLIAFLAIWIGALSIGMTLFGGFGILGGAIIGWVATIWLFKNLKQQ